MYPNEDIRHERDDIKHIHDSKDVVVGLRQYEWNAMNGGYWPTPNFICNLQIS